MLELLLAIARACWQIFAESAPYVLFGFCAAGLLKGFLPQEAVTRHLGRGTFGAVLKASLFGVPLPLCSCGVIPAAVELRRQGAGKGPAAAFLVSVPETGVDSIAITYALLDPLLTLLRPLAAFLTATVTGVLINLLPDDAPPPAAPASSGCGCSSPAETGAPARSRLERLRQGLDYAFGELLQDIGRWLLLGILIAGLLAALLPADFFTRHLDNEPLSLLLMLGIGVPLYICASASTPIAAALVVKGLSPGAALVFLLAGPATNAATITCIRRYWGGAATALYLASIAVCSLLLGWLTNRLYDWSGLALPHAVTATGPGAATRPWELAAALLLAALLLRPWWPGRRTSAAPAPPPGGG